MTLIRFAFALTLAAPAVVWSQPAPAAPSAVMNASFEKMQSNVAKIIARGEKERWRANVALWQVALSHPGQLDKADLEKMTAALTIITANVEKIVAPAEKERWQANRDLWQIVVNEKGKISPAAAEKMKAVFAMMKANVARISETAEKERWRADKDLWQAKTSSM